jgi:hypothetical protein
MDIALLWVSRSLIDPYSPEMLQVVRTAVPRNRALGVTGALYFDETSFFQMLEGPKVNVHAIYERIASDWRHTDVTIVDEHVIGARLFAGHELKFVDGARQRHHRRPPEIDFITRMAPGQRRELALTLLRG